MQAARVARSIAKSKAEKKQKQKEAARIKLKSRSLAVSSFLPAGKDDSLKTITQHTHTTFTPSEELPKNGPIFEIDYLKYNLGSGFLICHSHHTIIRSF